MRSVHNGHFQILFVCSLFFASCNSSRQTNYDQPEKVVVIGKILNPDSSKDAIGLSINRVGFEQEALVSPVDEDGSFRFQFESYVPTDAWLTYQTNFLIQIYPGDSLFVQFDGSKEERPEILKTIEFINDKEGINKHLAQFQYTFYQSNLFTNWQKKDSAIKHLESGQFRIFADSLQAERIKLYNHFVLMNSPNEEVKNWIRVSLKEHYFSDLTFYPDSHRKINKLKQREWDVPLAYYDYFKESVTVPGSGAALWGITDKYTWRYIGIRVRNSTPKDRPYSTDSAYFQNILSLTSDPLLKEMAITQYFYSRLNEMSLDFFEKKKELIRANISYAFLREPLFTQYERVKKEVSASSLTADTHTKKLETKNGFLKEVIAAHKGKPLYIDIWATWCGPCVEEFPYSRDLQQELKEVTFVYLCVSSEEQLYLNALKKYKLEGYHYWLNGSQSDALYKDHKLMGIPHYMLINTTGKIIYEGYSLRPSEDDTKDKILAMISIQ